MEGTVEFNFIYSCEAVKVKEFIGTIPRNIDYVNYIDIVNKLTKNDYYQHEPSDEVISSFLVKQLHSIFDKDVDSVFYVLGDLDDITVTNIMSFVESICDKEFKYNLYHYKETNIKGFEYLFKEINEFE